MSSKDPDFLQANEAFLLEQTFPDAPAAFSEPRAPVADVLPRADIVLDTNVLLLPYRADPSSLKQIVAVLMPIRENGRLFVPGRVAREFARLRPTKLAELHQALSDQRSRIVAPPPPKYPLLEGIAEYQDMLKMFENLAAASKSYQAALKTLIEAVRAWEGGDPVSKAYSQLFTPTCVRDPEFNSETELKELKSRYTLKVPPGYKDGSKPDDGIGDYLIWKTILDIGNERQNPLVFITGEMKADWHHRSNNIDILPRFELIDEYRRVSNGASLYILQMSRLMKLLEADPEAVEEIKKEERRERDEPYEQAVCPQCKASNNVRVHCAIGSSALPHCFNCGSPFHVHRGPGGIFVREPGSRRRELEKVREQVFLECPHCSVKAAALLGREPGDSAWCHCGQCGTSFHGHRAQDGSVFSRPRGSYTESADEGTDLD